MSRNYEQIVAAVSTAGDRAQRMRSTVDALWRGLAETGVSWVGFYLYEGGEELVLGPREPKPACSPIGLHGACGQALRQRRVLIVRDVVDLGEHYVACDPRDQSEVVLPLFEQSGACWGVLDLDSHAVGSFDECDVAGLARVLRAAGLTV